MHQSKVALTVDRSGVAPKFIRTLHAPANLRPPSEAPDDLFVTDFGSGAMEALENSTWQYEGSITSGMNGPDGAWVGAHNRIYVANYAGIYIQEYRPGSPNPIYTYNAGMTDPIGVTTDLKANVYEADYLGGFVNEYKQQSNTVINTCTIPSGNVEGVAVDKAGDVFVDYNNTSTGAANIAEFKGGLSGCNMTVLGVQLTFAGGMVLDANNNLVVCDQLGPTVDVIAPPYSSVTSTLGSGYADPFHVTLSKDNTMAFVADVGNANVQVLSYPSGSNQATLNSANNLVDPAAAVDINNFVP